jgi:alpha-L-fucosidase
MTRFWAILAILLVCPLASAQTPAPTFAPTWDSLAKNYHCPDWYRDAKFGIWAHWTAQCVPEQGDWYARNMYIQGTPQYEYHVAHYGPPSKFGFMELDNLWHAEHWDPEKLMQLYKAAGAKYFVALANHHDNFDCYNSKYQQWNSVRVGPHKDIVGTWEKVAREAGLRFGVSNHSSHAWHWFQVAYGYDAVGPYAGVRYDGYLTKADGIGKWWEGLDPQELYTGPHLVIPGGITSVAEAHHWHDVHDGHWYETAPPDDPAFARKWLLRFQDLVDQYHPDFAYFDDTELPLGQAGLDAAAYYYNGNIAHNGKLEAVLTAKQLSPAHRPALVEDYERGASDKLQPLPWQTDTCIGNWHYLKGIKYKSVGQVTQTLVDVVSKNGNLLLSIPIRGDGTIDDDEVTFLHGLTAWMSANGEGIFSSRPWKIFGEGPAKPKGGMFNEGKIHYGEKDIRFTTKDGSLYAYLLGAPTETIHIRSLGTDSGLADSISDIKLLGSDEALSWSQGADELVIQKPAHLPDWDVVGFKVTFTTNRG